MRCLGRDRAPAGDLTVDVRQHTRTWFALAQPAHVRDAPRHVQARVAVAHADASTRPRLARHHERCEVVKAPGGGYYVDLHATRIRKRPGRPDASAEVDAAVRVQIR